MGTPFRLRWQRLRETVEAMRVLWTQAEPSYSGKMVQFPAVRCEPKPVQPGGPPILLGGHGQKALERVARTCDGWCPIVDNPRIFGEEVAMLRRLTREADEPYVYLSPFVDPQEGRLSRDMLKAYRDAGATRVVLFPNRSGATWRMGKQRHGLSASPRLSNVRKVCRGRTRPFSVQLDQYHADRIIRTESRCRRNSQD